MNRKFFGRQQKGLRKNMRTRSVVRAWKAAIADAREDVLIPLNRTPEKDIIEGEYIERLRSHPRYPKCQKERKLRTRRRVRRFRYFYEDIRYEYWA